MNPAFGAIAAWILIGLQAVGIAEAARGDADQPQYPPPPADAGPSAPAATTDPAFEARLAALDAAMEKTTDFRADFEQKKYTPLLKHPLVSKGVLTSKGGLVRWETTEPHHVIVLIEAPSNPQPSREVNGESAAPTSAGEMRVYYPDDRLCEIYPIGGAMNEFAGALLPRLSELRKRFALSPIRPSEVGGADDRLKLVGLLLRPTSEELRKHVDSIKVLIDETIPSATKVVVTDADGEYNEITLTSIRINAGLKVADVQLALPEGVRLSRPLGAGAASCGSASAPGDCDPAHSVPPTPR